MKCVNNESDNKSNVKYTVNNMYELEHCGVQIDENTDIFTTVKHLQQQQGVAYMRRDIPPR